MLEVDGKFRCSRGGMIQSPVTAVGGREQLKRLKKGMKKVGREGTVGCWMRVGGNFKWRCAYEK